MCEKMEELKPTPRGLNLNDGWEQQVNSKAKRTDDRLEMEKKYWAEEEKRRRSLKRAKRIMFLFCLGFGLIVASGIYLGYAEEIPFGISVAVSMVYVALLSFLFGFLFGRKKRQ